MNTDIIIIISTAFALGWILGSKFTSLWLHTTFREILKDLGVTETQLRAMAEKNGVPISALPQPVEPSLPVVEVKLERMGDVIYAFRKDNDQFLGQGPDRDALVQRLTENLSNVRVIISKEDGADLLQKNNS